jgi:hypothetical protein
MKNTLIVLLAVTTVALGALCVVQSQKAATQQVQTAALRGELEAKSLQMETLQVAQQGAERQRVKLAAEAEALAAQLQAHKIAATKATAPAPALLTAPAAAAKENGDEDKGGLGTMVSKMMSNPEGRQFMRDQQRMMIDQSYGTLIKQMGLTPEEADKFKDMLADNTMKGAEKAFAAFGGAGATNSAEALKGLTTQQETFDAQLKDLLGDTRYAQYKDYSETLGDRVMLNQFKLQAGSDYNLSDPQSEALLNFMKEERKSVAASTGLPMGGNSKDPAKLQAMMSAEKVDEIIQAQQTVSQRVYERARTILSPEQLQTLGRFQTNQLQMTRMGMSMMRTLISPQRTSTTTPASQ